MCRADTRGGVEIHGQMAQISTVAIPVSFMRVNAATKTVRDSVQLVQSTVRWIESSDRKCKEIIYIYVYLKEKKKHELNAI